MLPTVKAVYCRLSLCHLYLPKPTLEIDTREVTGADHRFHLFLHVRQGVSVFLRPFVQFTEIDVEAQGPVFFPDEDYGIAPR